jgi:hypothetical protein
MENELNSIHGGWKCVCRMCMCVGGRGGGWGRSVCTRRSGREYKALVFFQTTISGRICAQQSHSFQSPFTGKKFPAKWKGSLSLPEHCSSLSSLEKKNKD